MAIKIEQQPTSQEALTKRNNFQKRLIERAMAEGVLDQDDLDRMGEMFQLVSDIIDNTNPDYESIKSAYENADYEAAIEMVLRLLKESK